MIIDKTTNKLNQMHKVAKLTRKTSVSWPINVKFVTKGWKKLYSVRSQVNVRGSVEGHEGIPVLVNVVFIIRTIPQIIWVISILSMSSQCFQHQLLKENLIALANTVELKSVQFQAFPSPLLTPYIVANLDTTSFYWILINIITVTWHI